MPFYITKASGNQELFDIKKFRRSLAKAGAPQDIIDLIAHDLELNPLKTTKEIYNYALQKLKVLRQPVATRYNLKHALMELGPAGFPFERYIAQLYTQMGYEVAHNQIAKGFCVEHEIDVLARKDNRSLLIECKFHNYPQLKSDLKVALYVKARNEDINKQWEHIPYQEQEIREAWLVTNTSFSTEAIRYAQCAGLKLLGWNYPEHKTLADLINEIGLHPITALTNLKRKQKQDLIKEGIVLCRDLRMRRAVMHHIGMSPLQIELAIHEAEGVCSVPTQN